MKNIFFLLMISYCLGKSISYGQALNGNYTIGGVSPDYLTINAAVSALNSNGIAGPVIFNIRPGVYSEKVNLTEVTGSSIVNTVTFQSEGLDASSVTITDIHINSTDAQNYTLYFNGIDNVIVKYLTVEAKEDPMGVNIYSKVIHVLNNSDNISLENNIIKSFYKSWFNDQIYSAITSGTSGTFAGTFRDNDSLFVINNKIIGGYNGLTIYGQSANLTNYLTVKGNEFTDQVEAGYYSNAVSEIFFEQNKITQSSFNTNQNFVGAKFYDSKKGLKIDRNNINITNGINALYFFLISGNQSSSKIISNNALFINGNNSSSCEGVFFFSTNDISFVHNTIDILRIGSNSYNCIKLQNTDSTRIFNNNFSINSSGKTYTILSSTVLTSDYNNHFNSSIGNLITYFGTTYSSLTTFQAGSNLDLHSYQENPNLSGNPMIIPNNLALFGTGISFPSVTKDYFGTTRSISNPCIGAYEGFPLSINAGISNSNFSNQSFCPGYSYPLTIKIKNFGSDTLTSALISFNGTTLNWIGTLATNQESNDISLGSWYVSNSFSQTLPYILVSQPNGQSDQFTMNDTLYISINPKLNGVYTVGGATADFLTIQQASSTLSLNGICGDITLNINPGIYNEQVVFENIPGLGDTNSLLIQSLNLDSSSVTCQFNATSDAQNHVLKFNNLSNIIINKLTIKPLNTSGYKKGLVFNNGKNIQVTNNKLENANIFYKSTSIGNKNISFLNNYMTNSTDYSSSVIYNGDNKLFIDGNIGFLIDSVVVSGNTMLGNNTRDIFINNVNELLISKNRCEGNRSKSTIELDTCNQITLIYNKLNIASNWPGIDLFKSVNSLSNQGKIHSNMIIGTMSMKGLSIIETTNLGVYHNTVNVSNNSVYYGPNIVNIDVRNNIFRSGATQCIYYVNASVINDVFTSNNSLYCTPTQPINIAGSNISFADFQQFYVKELNSIFSIPQFISPTDLHLATNSVAQDGIGVPISGIFKDIDGDSILALIDVGADQYQLDYSLFNNNIRLLEFVHPILDSCQLDSVISIRVVNVSDDIVNNFTVKLFLFGNLINQFIHTQTLNPLDSTTVYVQNYPFNTNTLFDLKAEVSMPNGQVDLYYPDNTVQKGYYYGDNFEIGNRRFEDCSQNIELFIPEIPYSSLLWNTGQSTSSIVVTSPGTYTVTVQFVSGCSTTKSITIN